MRSPWIVALHELHHATTGGRLGLEVLRIPSWVGDSLEWISAAQAWSREWHRPKTEG